VPERSEGSLYWLLLLLLLLLLSLFVLAVILSAAKDPDTFKPTHTIRTFSTTNLPRSLSTQE
jgi:hypothetical protein